MATLLSEMPEKSEMLQEWIAKHDQDVTQREQQLNQMTDQYRHQMGAMAMEQLVAQHPADQAQAAAQMPAPQAEGTAPSDAGAMGLGG
jgi:DNA-binding protein H-NS